MKEPGPSLLVVSGPVGVGKTTTGYQVSTQLGERGIPNTFVGIDALSETWPARPEDRFNQELPGRTCGTSGATRRPSARAISSSRL